MSVLVTLIVGELAHDNQGKQVALLAVPRVGEHVRIKRPGESRDAYGVVRRVIYHTEEDGQEPEVYVLATVEDHF